LLHNFCRIVKLSDKITTLGVTLDSTLTFKQHVSFVCKSANYHLRALRHIRPVLTEEMAMSIAVALIQSRLDYANSILYHTAVSNITKLQRIQNTAAHLVLPYSHLSANDRLTRLHWLPISRRIEFKLATITYKLLNTEQPSFLRSLIHYDNPVRQLRSSVQRRLHVPAIKTECMQMFGLLSVSDAVVKRKSKFLLSYSSSTNSLCQLFTDDTLNELQGLGIV